MGLIRGVGRLHSTGLSIPGALFSVDPSRNTPFVVKGSIHSTWTMDHNQLGGLFLSLCSLGAAFLLKD